MARIKIEDLPVLEDLSAKEKKGIFGGTDYTKITLVGTRDELLPALSGDSKSYEAELEAASGRDYQVGDDAQLAEMEEGTFAVIRKIGG